MPNEEPKVCNWCTKLTKLAKGKKSCNECISQSYRTCRRCQKPYDSKDYFQLDEKRCNACQRKYLKEKQTRETHKRSKSVDVEQTSSCVARKKEVKSDLSSVVEGTKSSEHLTDDDCIVTLHIPAKIRKSKNISAQY